MHHITYPAVKLQSQNGIPLKKVGKILRHESLETDFNTLPKIGGGVDLPRVFSFEADRRHWSYYYDVHTHAKILSIYKQDFDYFGYPKLTMKQIDALKERYSA